MGNLGPCSGRRIELPAPRYAGYVSAAVASAVVRRLVRAGLTRAQVPTPVRLLNPLTRQSLKFRRYTSRPGRQLPSAIWQLSPGWNRRSLQTGCSR
jgi:hypothetical protein